MYLLEMLERAKTYSYKCLGDDPRRREEYHRLKLEYLLEQETKRANRNAAILLAMGDWT